jgi:hypothetical protein
VPISRNSFVVSSNRGVSTSSKWSLLEQAERWDRLAVAELEDYFKFNSPDYDEDLQVTSYANARCEMVAAA